MARLTAEQDVGWGRAMARLGPALLAACGLAVAYGFREQLVARQVLMAIQLGLLAVYWAVVFTSSTEPWRRWRSWPWTDLALLGASVGAGTTYFALNSTEAALSLEVICLLLVLREMWRLQARLARTLARPALLLPLSFGLLIVVGTALLKLPVATPEGAPIGWIDALFTATSAVCVTGLVVRTTATGFTLTGQTIIVVLIQLGGLGIIIFGSMLAMLFGRSLSLRENLNIREMLGDLPLYRITSFVRFIVIVTLLTELVGAALLFGLWEQPANAEPLTFVHRLHQSVFQSVSAFCNAGFDTLGDSLVSYRYGLLTHGVIAPLIVLGGLGAPTLANLFRIARDRLTRRLLPRRYHPNLADLTLRRMSLNTKIVLATTAAAYLAGVVVLLSAEIMPHFYEALRLGQTAHVVRPGPLTLDEVGRRLADASFMSISARTAGFNSVPMEELRPASRFALMSLMFVGGSPGGTAGGVKTTVIALLVLSTVAAIRQRQEVEAFGRAIADSLIRKAATIFYCYAAVIAAAVLLLSLSEPFRLELVLFEAVSAATTTGLSLGITPHMTAFGKVVLVLTMFLGRVGPLALLGALVLRRRPQRPYAFPHEDVVIG